MTTISNNDLCFVAQLREALAVAGTAEMLPAYAAIENFFADAGSRD